MFARLLAEIRLGQYYDGVLLASFLDGLLELADLGPTFTLVVVVPPGSLDACSMSFSRLSPST